MGKFEKFLQLSGDEGSIEEARREDGDSEEANKTTKGESLEPDEDWPFYGEEDVSYEFGIQKIEKIRRYVNLTLKRFLTRLETKYCLTDLCPHNPPGNARVPIGHGWVSWHRFIGSIAGDCFPEITSNRHLLFKLVLGEVIIPIYQKDAKEAKDMFTVEKIRELRKKAKLRKE